MNQIELFSAKSKCKILNGCMSVWFRPTQVFNIFEIVVIDLHVLECRKLGKQIVELCSASNLDNLDKISILKKILKSFTSKNSIMRGWNLSSWGFHSNTKSHFLGLSIFGYLYFSEQKKNIIGFQCLSRDLLKQKLSINNALGLLWTRTNVLPIKWKNKKSIFWRNLFFVTFLGSKKPFLKPLWTTTYFSFPR